MALDINNVCITGIVHDIGFSPTAGLYPVFEARLTVKVGCTKDSGYLYDEMNIRAFGKKTIGLDKLIEGDRVMIQGKLKEDIRVNADNPNTTRSKLYVNIDILRIEGDVE